MNMLFRNLFGNLLSAVGEMKKKTHCFYIFVDCFGILLFILVPKFQILGMGISVFLAMSFSGFLGDVFFWKYSKIRLENYLCNMKFSRLIILGILIFL